MKKLICLLGLAVSACDVIPNNPFDPATPLEQQALAALQGEVVAPQVAPTSISVTLASAGREPRSKALEADGTFAFADLVPGRWSLTLSASGYYPHVRDLELVAGVTLDLGPVVLVPVVDTAQLVAVEGRARLAGLRSSAGVAVEVVGTAFRTVTDTEGRYLLQLTPGLYTLAFSAVGFKGEEVVDLDVPQGAAVTVPDVTLAANPASVAGHVCAQVRDDLLQAGVTGGQGACEAAGPSYAPAFNTSSSALVTVRGPDSPDGRATTVDGDGFFSIGDLSPGSYTVTVEWLGHRRAFVQSVTVSGGEDVVLAAPLLLELARGGIEGVVTLPTGAADHSGTLVSVEGWAAATTTDAQGRFSLSGLLDSALVGGYQLVATHRPTYADLRLPVDVRVEADRLTRLDRAYSLDVRTGAVQVKEGYYLRTCALTLVMASPTAKTYRVSLLPDLSDATALAFEPPDPQRPGEFPWVMPDCESLPDGRRTIHVEFADEAGTPGAPATVEILLDRKAPAGLEASLAGAEAQLVDGVEGPVFFTRSTSGLVALQLSALDPLSVESDDPALQQPGSGLARVLVDDSPDFDAPVPLAFAGAVSVALPEPGVDGLKRLYLRFEDRAGNVSVLSDGDDQPRPLLVVLDRLAPADLSVAVRALSSPPDPGSTPSAQVALELEAQDEHPLLMSMRVSNDPGFRGAAWQPFVAFVPWVLSPDDGLKTVYFQVRDAAGNEAPVVSSQILLSTQPPTAVEVELLAPVARQGQVSGAATVPGGLSLGLSATGAAQMELSGDLADGATGWIPFAPTWTGRLTNGDGTKTVQARFRTGAGSVASAPALVLVLDTTAPLAGTPALSPSPFTGGVDVTLSLAATAADEMRLSGDLSSVAGLPANVGAWLPAAPTVAAKLTAGDGAKTVSVTYRDFAGNLSTVASASTTLDASPPSGSLTIEGPVDAGATSTSRTGARQVVLNVDGQDGAGSGVTHLRLANTSGALSSATWVPFQANASWTLPAGDGAKTVHLQLRDAVGNVSAVSMTATTTLDQTPPSAPVLAALPAATNAASVSVALSTPSSDTLSGPPRYEWLRTGSGAWTQVTLPAALTLVEGINSVQVRAIDLAGNVSASAVASVVRDVTAPPKPGIVTPRIYVSATTTSVTLTGSEMDPNFLTYRTCTRQVSGGASCPATCTTWEDSSAGFALSLVANGKTCLYARGVDRAGNESGAVSVGLVSDLTRPVAPAIGPQYSPSLLTVRAGSVDAFLLTAATDAPTGNPSSPWVGISHLEVGGDGGFAPLCPSSLNVDRWDPCNPLSPNGLCTDERLRCRGTSVMGFNAVVREGTRTTVSVRAIDLAGNVSDASSFQVENEAPFAVTQTGGSEEQPDLYGTTLAYYWESNNNTGVVPRLIELGENRRPDPTDPSCVLDPRPPPHYSMTVDIDRAGVVYEQNGTGLFLRRRGADGLFCTADDPAHIKLHPTGATYPPQYFSVALGGDAVAFANRDAVSADGCAPVMVREGANFNPLGGADRIGMVPQQAHVSYYSTPPVQLAEGVLLVRTGGCPTPVEDTSSEWTVVHHRRTAAGYTYLSPQLTPFKFTGGSPVLSDDGSMVFDVGGAATIRHAGSDGRFGTADDKVVTRAVPGHSFDPAIDGSRAMFITSDSVTGQTYWQVWGAGADGVFQSDDDPADDDDYRAIYPSSESRRFPALSQGLAIHESRGNLYGMDLTSVRWEAVLQGHAENPQDSGSGGLVYVDSLSYVRTLVARAADGSETIAPLNFALDGGSGLSHLADERNLLVVGRDEENDTVLEARRRAAGQPWFVSDAVRRLTLPGGPHEYTLAMASGAGRAIVYAGPWVNFRKYVLQPAPDGSWTSTGAGFVDVTGTSPVNHNPDYAGVSASHVAWTAGYSVYEREAGKDGVFGTADDGATKPLIDPASSWPYSVKMMALDGQRVAISGNAWNHIRVVDAGADGTFSTADDVNTDVPVQYPGVCIMDCELRLSGSHLSWISPDASGTDQVYVHNLSTRSTMRLTSHDSTKSSLTTFMNGRVSWLDQLFQTRSIFTFTP